MTRAVAGTSDTLRNATNTAMRKTQFFIGLEVGATERRSLAVG
jgi:hypothetical protein